MVVRQHKETELEVSGGNQGTCENHGISEETTKLMAIQKLMQSCHDLTGAWLTVRGDCTIAGGASFLTCDPGGEQI